MIVVDQETARQISTLIDDADGLAVRLHATTHESSRILKMLLAAVSQRDGEIERLRKQIADAAPTLAGP